MDRDESFEIKLGPRTRGMSIAVAVVVAVLALLDFVVLKGERVVGFTTSLRDKEPDYVELVRAGEPHTVQIRATRRSGGETKGRSVDYRIVGPNGTVVEDESEFVNRKTRHVRFTPYVAGEYAITVSDDSTYPRDRSSNPTATVSITVNDRRILPRLLPF